MRRFTIPAVLLLVVLGCGGKTERLLQHAVGLALHCRTQCLAAGHETDAIPIVLGVGTWPGERECYCWTGSEAVFAP